MSEIDWKARYWLKKPDGSWSEVSDQEFASAERRAGFYPKGGGIVATGGFSDSYTGLEGRATYGDIDPARYQDDHAFLAALSSST